MNKEEKYLWEYEMLYILMKIYKDGTGKQTNNLNKEGGWEIVDFIIRSKELFNTVSTGSTLDLKKEWLIDLFDLLNKYHKEDDK